MVRTEIDAITGLNDPGENEGHPHLPPAGVASSVRLGFCMVATGKPLEKILPEASFSLTNSL